MFLKLFADKKFMIAMLSLWGILLIAGFGFLWDYSNKPGPSGEPPTHWPVQSNLQRDSQKPTLIMFAHPRCSCSRASMEELTKIYTDLYGKITINIVFYHHNKFKREWVYSDLWNKAQTITEANLVIDSNFKEIDLFQPKTSGQVYLYSKDGELVYSGGITGSRGHVGDNIGRRSIISWVNEKKIIKNNTFVFGCTLFHTGEELGLNEG